MSMLGKHHSPETKRNMSSARIGKPKSKETKEKMSKAHIGKQIWWLGKHHTPETIEKMRKNSGNYKGDKVGYSPLHRWIKSRKPKPKVCEFCHKEKDKLGHTRLTLANIKNHQYSRNPDDYKWGHYDCHSDYDGNNKIYLQLNRDNFGRFVKK